MTEKEIVALVFLCVMALAIPCAAEWVAWSNEVEYKFLSPATLKRATKMNWVGCILTWVGLGLISPLIFIYKCIYNLFHL